MPHPTQRIQMIESMRGRVVRYNVEGEPVAWGNLCAKCEEPIVTRREAEAHRIDLLCEGCEREDRREQPC